MGNIVCSTPLRVLSLKKISSPSGGFITSHVFNLSSNDKGNPGNNEDTNGNKGELKDGAKAHMEVVVDVSEKNFTMGVLIKIDQGNVGIYWVLDDPASADGPIVNFFLKDGKINFRT